MRQSSEPYASARQWVSSVLQMGVSVLFSDPHTKQKTKTIKAVFPVGFSSSTKKGAPPDPQRKDEPPSRATLPGPELGAGGRRPHADRDSPLAWLPVRPTEGRAVVAREPTKL